MNTQSLFGRWFALAAFFFLFASPPLVRAQGASCGITGQCQGKITVVADAVAKALPQNTATVFVTVAGTWTGTLQFWQSGDGGATFALTKGTQQSTGAQVSSTTSDDQWRFNASGLTNFEVLASAAITGTATVTISASEGSSASGGAASPLTNEGDIYAFISGANARLPVGSNGQCLTSNGTDPTWGSCTSGANTTLSNLGTTAINANLNFASENTYDITNLRNLYFSGSLIGGASGLVLSGAPAVCGAAGTGLGQLCLSSTGNRIVYGYNGGANTNVALTSDLTLSNLLAGTLATTFNMGTQAAVTLVPNDTTTGTTVNLLAKLTQTGAIITSTSDSPGSPANIVVNGAGKSGSAQLSEGGTVSCVMNNSASNTEGQPVFKSVVGIDPGTPTAGRCYTTTAALSSTGWFYVGHMLDNSTTAGSAASMIVHYGWFGANGGANVQTSSYSLLPSDNGKLVVMNCSGACAVTMPNPPPSAVWSTDIETVGSTNATVSLNSLTFNGSAAIPALGRYRDMEVTTDGSNYFGRAPITSGTGVSITPAANNITVGLTIPCVVTSGCTGATTAAGAMANLCPTCITGPNSATLGGIIGGFIGGAPASGKVNAWFTSAQSANQQFMMPFDAWIENPAIYLRAAGAGSGTQAFGVALNAASTTFTATADIATAGYNPATSAYVGTKLRPTFVGQGLSSGFYNSTNSAGTGLAGSSGFSAQIIGVNAQPLGNNLNGVGVAQSTIAYTGPSMSNTAANTTIGATEVVCPWTYGCSLKNLGIFMVTANGASTTLVVSVVKNESATPTSLSFTVPVSSVALEGYADSTAGDAVSLVQGDRFGFKLNNGSANGTSGTIAGISVEADPVGGTAQGWIVWGTNGVTLTAAGTTYGAPFTNSQNATEANERGPVPSTNVAVNLACYVTTAPLVATEVVTLLKNGSQTNVTLTIPTGQSVPAVVADYFALTTHQASYAAGDTFDLQYTNGAGGTAAVISSCSLETGSAAE